MATAANSVFESLPGIDVAVAGVHRALAAMWDGEPGPDAPAPPEVRASQMNLLLHFGLDATPDRARQGFETALAFSRRHPCRIIVLCPRAPRTGDDVAARIFSECHLGVGGQEKTCTEAIILSYPLEQRAFIENQASIMIESDLPIYYWPQYIQLPARMADYPFFISSADRIVLDSVLEHPGMLSFPWPRPTRVRDLAWTRTLPIRQAVGHFLSYIPPARLVDALREVRIAARPDLRIEADQLLAWARSGLEACARQAGVHLPAADFSVAPEADSASCLRLEWLYTGGGLIRARLNLRDETGCLEASLAGEELRVSSTVRLLSPPAALAEALFF